MHLAEITKENQLGLKVGSELICEDINAGEMLSRGWCKVKEADARCTPMPIYKDWDYNGKKILFVRPGGFGDLLFLTPTLAETKRKWPTAEVWIACFERFHSVLVNNPNVDGFIDYPVAVDKWLEFDAHCWLESIIEENEEAKTIHAVDLVAQRAGIDITDKRMQYFVTGPELTKADREFPKNTLRNARIGIQITPNNTCRQYPFSAELSRRLWQNGHEVFLFGTPGTMDSNEPEGVVNLMKRKKTFRESCAILATCDVVVAPDSVMAHVAGALKIPCVALYGPFPWKLRTAYAEETFALQGNCPVSPCFHHTRPGVGVFPDYGPCSSSGRCEALAMITPERVIREVEKKLASAKKSEMVAA